MPKRGHYDRGSVYQLIILMKCQLVFRAMLTTPTRRDRTAAEPISRGFYRSQPRVNEAATSTVNS
jgi:hypothetical protein